VLWLSVDDVSEASAPEGVPVWCVRNKVDLVAPGGAESARIIDAANPRQLVTELGQAVSGSDGDPMFWISASRGDGLPELVEALARYAGQYFGVVEGGLISRERHRVLLRDAAAALQRGVHAGGVEELVAEELRIAANALGRLLGRVDVEDLLDVIFREFCVGK
jgi:tRNA modification GTPase